MMEAHNGYWQARYSDGKTAASLPAQVTPIPGSLVIQGEDGRTFATWPASEVRLIDSPGADGQVRLARAKQAGRLTITTPGILPELERACPALRKSAYGGPNWRAVAIWSLAAVSSFAFVLFVLLPFGARQAADWVSPSFEAELGERSAQAIISLVTGLDALTSKKQTDKGQKPEAGATNEPKVVVVNKSPECTEQRGVTALNKMTAPLLAQLHAQSPVRIRVIRSAMVNAVALPGGQILVFKGLIDFVKGPNELAGVLAHEMSHIELRHPTEVVIERSASAFLIGLLFGDVFGGSAMAGLGQVAISARYSQNAERAADARGIMLMEAAGLNPGPFATFFKRLLEKQGAYADVASFLNSHPATAERAKLAEQAPSVGRAALDGQDWSALKQICG